MRPSSPVGVRSCTPPHTSMPRERRFPRAARVSMCVAGGSCSPREVASRVNTSSEPGPETTSADARSYDTLSERPTAVSTEPR